MKAYIVTTGILFGLLTVVHLVRIVMESTLLAKDPWFILITVVAAGLCLWAWRLLRQPTRQ